MSAHSKQLPALQVHDVVAIQDQAGHTPRRWSKTGKVVEVLGNDSYMIKVDGSNRTTKRNRQFLRKLGLYQPDKDLFDPLPPLPVPPVPVIDAPDQLEDQPDRNTPDQLGDPTEEDNPIPYSTTPAVHAEEAIARPATDQSQHLQDDPWWTTRPCT